MIDSEKTKELAKTYKERQDNLYKKWNSDPEIKDALKKYRAQAMEARNKKFEEKP